MSAHTMVDVFRQGWRHHPDRPLYICSEPPVTSMSWGDIGRSAMAIAAELVRRRVRKGQCVLLVYPPDSLHFPAAMWACMLSGVVAVPVATPNPMTLAADVESLSRVADNCRASVALTDTRYQRLVRLGGLSRLAHRMVGRAEARWPSVDWVATDRLPDADEDATAGVSIGPDDLAYLQYTSGSTGHPKGVEIRHGQLLANLRLIGRDAAMTAEDVLLMWVPWFHDMGLVAGILNAPCQGCQLVYYSALSFLKNPASWLETAHRFRVTGIAAPGFGYDLVARRVREDQGADWDLSAVRLALLGGEVARPETLRAFAARFARNGFRAESFRNVYGMAEATLYICGIGPKPAQIVAFDADTLAEGRARPVARGAAPGAKAEIVSIGRPTDDAAGELLVVRDGLPCAPGQVGELWLASPSVSAGYHGNPQASQQTFAGELRAGAPQAPGRRYLRTGDLAFQWEGAHFICGRSKDLIIVGGRNIYPGDIEDSIRVCDPRIRTGGVAVFATRPADSQIEQIAVIVEARDPRMSREACEEVVAAVMRTVLTQHQVRCSAVFIAPAGAILKTSSGKVRRGACRDAIAAGRLATLHGHRDSGPPEAPSTRVPRAAQPDTDLEAWILDWLAETLRLPRSGMDARTPFLALGCDSLAMVQLGAEVGDRAGVILAPEAPWLYPSPRQLAEHARALQSGQDSGAWAVRAGLWRELADGASPVEGEVLTAREQAFLARVRAFGDHPTLVLSTHFTLGSELDPARVRRAFQRVIDDQPLLRTRYLDRADPPACEVSLDVQAAVEVHDLRAQGADEALAQARALRDTLSQQGIPVHRAPLARVDLIALPGQPVIVHVRAHHLICDGLGLIQLRDALARATEAPDAPRRAATSDISGSSRTFAIWQRRYFASEEGQRRLAEARARLARVPPEAFSPWAPAADLQAGSTLYRATRRVDPAQLERWSALARDLVVPVSAVMAAGYGVLLRCWLRPPSVALQAVTSLRSVPCLRQVFGDLANDYGLICDAPLDAPFFEQIAHVVREEQEARSYADVPWSWLGRTEAALVFQFHSVGAQAADPLADPTRSLVPTRGLTAWRDGLLAVLRIATFGSEAHIDLTTSGCVGPESVSSALLDAYLELLDKLVANPDEPPMAAAAAAVARAQGLGASGPRA